MQVAYLTNQLPWPPQSGGQVREWELLKRLSATCSIHFLAVTEHLERDRAELKALPGRFISVALVPSASEKAPEQMPSRMRQHYSQQFSYTIGQLLRREAIELIHVEGYFLMQHVPATHIPILLMAENVEYVIAGRLSHDSAAALDAEIEAIQRATAVAAVTAGDADVIRSLVPKAKVFVIPNGADHLESDPMTESPDVGWLGRRPYLVYVANYSWFPSTEGAAHLVTRLWPEIHLRFPDATLVLAGPAMSRELGSMASTARGVEPQGYIQDLTSLYARADLVLCPCRIGGGSKIKMLEALALGKPIVALEPCTEGLPPQAIDGICVCRSDAEFITSVVSLLGDHDARRRLAQRAIVAARELPTWDRASEVLLRVWREVADASVA